MNEWVKIVDTVTSFGPNKYVTKCIYNVLNQYHVYKYVKDS